jgi:hypothetical protein
MPPKSKRVPVSKPPPRITIQPEVPVICCSDIILIVDPKSNLPAFHKSLIYSLITEVKLHFFKPHFQVEPAPPRTPKKFRYVIQVTTRISNPDTSSSFLKEELATDKPWRWFVPFNEDLVPSSVESEESEEENIGHFSFQNSIKYPTYQSQIKERNWVEIESAEVPVMFTKGMYEREATESLRFRCNEPGHMGKIWTFQVLAPHWLQTELPKPVVKKVKREISETPNEEEATDGDDELDSEGEEVDEDEYDGPGIRMKTHKRSASWIEDDEDNEDDDYSTGYKSRRGGKARKGKTVAKKAKAKKQLSEDMDWVPTGRR